MIMSVGGVSGSSQVQLDGLSTVIGGGDMESVLLAFGVERAQDMESLVKAKVADMRQRNANIQELQQAMQTIRAAKPAGDDPATTASTPELAHALEVLKQNGVALPEGLTAQNQPQVERLQSALDELDTLDPAQDK